MTRKRRNRLELREVDQISLVDAGDNPGAHVVIHKRDKGGVDIMDKEHDEEDVRLWKRVGIRLGLVDEDDQITKKEGTKVAKEDKDLDERLQKLEKRAETAEAINAAVDAVSKAESTEEVDAVLKGIEDDDVLKAVTDRAEERKTALAKSADDDVVKAFREKLPEPMRPMFDQLESDDRAAFMKSYGTPEDNPVAKQLEEEVAKRTALETRLEKLETSGREAEIAKELDALDGIIRSVPETAKAIAGLEKSAPEAAATMLEEHRSLAAQVAEKTDIFKDIGNDRKGSGDANEALDAAVAKYREENPDVGEAKAMDAVMKLQPELYTAIREEREE